MFGLHADLDLGCGVLLLRLDSWMAPRTGGLLADRGGHMGGWLGRQMEVMVLLMTVV